MILNDTKIVFIHPSCVGGGIIRDNLSDEHQQDLENSFYTPYNQYIKQDSVYSDYFNVKGMIYSHHIYRYFFDNIFIGNRNNFFYSTMIRNPWCQSLSFAKHIVRYHKLNIPFTLDHKKEINDIITDIYSNKYPVEIPCCYYYYYLINSYGKILDYDYIVYFEDIYEDLKKFSKLSGLKFNNKLNISYQPIDYREYLTIRNIDLITKKRELDIQLFGYDFEKGILFKNNRPKIQNNCSIDLSKSYKLPFSNIDKKPNSFIRVKKHH